METMRAFLMGEANRGKPSKVFDWHKAARLIRESGAQNASAGLESDWEYTGGRILENGKPVSKDNAGTYLASTWATPELEINGELVDCFVMESEAPGWDAGTFWPESALAILRGEDTC